MKWRRLGGIATTVVLLSLATAKAEPPIGFGILGDSYSDEYQFYQPDRSTARNWVEILAETRGLNFGRFQVSSRGEPRNQGFEFNWARSDATTDDMIATGQHLGLAGQVARGDVKIVLIFIGGNDFINAWNSSDPDSALTEVAPRAMHNLRTAVDTILEADSRVRIMVGTLPDIRNLPDCARVIESGTVSTRTADEYSAAMSRFNTQIRALAMSHPRIALIDLDLTVKMLNLRDSQSVTVAGFKLDRHRPSNELDHFFLGDSRHPGSVGQGMIAQTIVETLNSRFNAGIKSLSSREIIHFARNHSTDGRIYAVQKPRRGKRIIPWASSMGSGRSAP